MFCPLTQQKALMSAVLLTDTLSAEGHSSEDS